MYTVLFALIIIFLLIFAVIVLQEYGRHRILILLYHRLIEDALFQKMIAGSERMFTMPAQQFEQQMQFLMNEGYSFLGLDDLMEVLKKKKLCPSKPVVITFDDGFQSVFRYAYPVLKKLNIKATVFLTTDAEAEFFKKYRSFDKPLSDEEVKSLYGGGISIQSHAHTHKPLVAMKEDEVIDEIAESKARIKRVTEMDPRYIAIPGGFSSRKLMRVLKNQGFIGICTSLAGTNGLDASPFTLRRLISEGTYTIKDFEKSLRPFNISIRRIISFLKRIPTKIINPYRWLRIRKRIYDSWVGKYLTYNELRKFFIVMVILLIILFMILLYKLAS